MFHRTEDESVVDSEGRVRHFGLWRFIREIAQGDKCFICGTSPGTVPFNNEHILPDWVLRKYDLHNRAITLPNNTQFRYGGFTIPCCELCNEYMGRQLEEPISAMFASGPKEFNKRLRENGPWRLFVWMCLIFLKTHLKDTDLRIHLDARKGQERIGDLHDWEELHHIHCMARAAYTHCELKQDALGSLLVLPAKVLPYFEKFDYVDLSFAQTMLIRLDDIAVVAVLNDSQAALSVIYEDIGRITAPLSPVQLREIATRMAAINIHLKDRPRFGSKFDLLAEEHCIHGQRPSEIHLEGWNDGILGKMMHYICAPALPNVPEKVVILENIKSGKYSFLFRDDGTFASDHMDEVP